MLNAFDKCGASRHESSLDRIAKWPIVRDGNRIEVTIANQYSMHCGKIVDHFSTPKSFFS